jgi:hypothetical protein
VFFDAAISLALGEAGLRRVDAHRTKGVFYGE